MRSRRITAGLALACALAGAASAQDIVFASETDARRVLTTRDGFVERLSPFDRAGRLKTDRDVSEREYLDFVASAAMAWTAAEKNTIQAALGRIRPGLARLALPLPSQVLLVKTSGREEGGAAYTRGNAIVLPANILGAPPGDLDKVLAHELFHVVSRTHPHLVKPLYAAIGFKYCGDIDLPANLEPRRITNPDAPRNDYCVKVLLGGEATWAVPVLYAARKYDPTRGGEFFAYLQFGFLRVDWPFDGRPAKVWRNAQGERIARLYEVGGLREQIGFNTEEILHPEEIVAENVALLVIGARNVPSPDVLARIETALTQELAKGADGKAARP